jgi:phosphatidylglycerophosphate synthase
MTLANAVTLFRTLLIPLIIAILFLGRIYISVAIFVVFLLGDLADGILARKRGEVTLFGKFLDPFADKILVDALLFSFAWIEEFEFSWWPFIFLAIQQLGLLAGSILFFSEKRPIFSSRYIGKAAAFVLSLGIGSTFLTLPFYREIIYVGIAISYLAAIDYFKLALKNRTPQQVS